MKYILVQEQHIESIIYGRDKDTDITEYMHRYSTYYCKVFNNCVVIFFNAIILNVQDSAVELESKRPCDRSI